ncbi:hypothetical protein NLJ89_g9292 [Agrocybe chaxingu]|uniref:alpha-amylase n=1 Tax=Agrocybe chaxingu TaxID=84603 RepID=A0A9W8MTP0_9AGAR|nr:hypothetical protein NLJ89_g9292 [Agrocybe chaxingu]
MRSLKNLAALLSLFPAAFALPQGVRAIDDVLRSRAPSGSKSVIVQMFEWNWDSIASECTNFLGPAGYGFVQVSPPAEHISGSQWWTDYQPVSYILTSKRGDRSQFSRMINVCHAAGVGVISGTGVAGSSFTHYNYPGIYQNQDFHHCGLTSNDDISDYGNRQQVQTCELSNLADLATGTDYVRGRLAAYANDLLSLGVDGLRLDAAKHIAAGDIANVLSRLSTTTYITQEVIYGSGEAVQPSEYTGNGDVQEFRYTYANGGSLKYNAASNIYVTAHVFSLAHPYGTPTVLSSYSFSSNDAGSPNSGTGTCSATSGTNGWLCQHRYTAISGMVGFRNNVGSAAINNWISPQSQQIAFGRGALGFVAINNADSAWTATFSTSLPDGQYCDVISGSSSSGTCTGTGVSVSAGSFSVTVPARNAIAIHTGALGAGGGDGGGTVPPPVVSVTFQETATTVWGENIFIVGSLSQLGSWSPAAAIALSSATYPVWSVTISLPASTTFQYKFIRKQSDGTVIWESDPNRQATTGSSGSQTITSSWR